jgi:hypothetical protein
MNIPNYLQSHFCSDELELIEEAIGRSEYPSLRIYISLDWVKAVVNDETIVYRETYQRLLDIRLYNYAML